MTTAIVRAVPRSMEACELTFLERATIDAGHAGAQQRAYADGLERAGLDVVRLPADEAHPDCCFVEDTAVVLDEVAIVTSLGAPSRRGETSAVEAELRKHRTRVEKLSLPATLRAATCS